MKYLRLISDIHLDFDVSCYLKQPKESFDDSLKSSMNLCWMPKPLSTDKDTCLIIAGDLWTKRKFVDRLYHDGESWLKKISKLFKYVIINLGNHDYWGANLTFEADKVRASINSQNLNNVFLLKKDFFVLDNIKIIGGTLWTSFNNGDPLVMLQAPGIMNDYRKITVENSYSNIKPENLYNEFLILKDFIFKNSKRDNEDQKVIVVTHMAPSEKSIHPMYLTNSRYNNANYYYYSNLENDICNYDTEIDIWCHGHTHNKSKYLIGDTVVYCNPRGYVINENTNYDEDFIIDLSLPIKSQFGL